MEIKVVKVKQYNSTYKHVIMIDGEPVCLTNSDKMASECIQYLNGYTADINDGKVRKALDKYRMAPVNKETEKVKKRKQKALHKFHEERSNNASST